MANMYGYTDYNGPLSSEGKKNDENDSESDDDDPLRVGQWMEGDSLAPPCGTAVPTIHKLLEFASVNSNDVVYDLGCGDGRICLEALVKFDAAKCVGVEVEEDLVERFQALIDVLPEVFTKEALRIQAIRCDLRETLDFLVEIAESNNDETAAVNEKFKELPTPTVLVLYLLPESIRELEEHLLKLIAGLPAFRLLCNTWGLDTIEASETLEVAEEGSGATSVFRLYDKSCLR